MITDGRHVGSIPIREMLLAVSPLVCLTGHIHEGIGTDKLGTCAIVNPGPFRKGRFAEIEIPDEFSVKINLKQITV